MGYILLTIAVIAVIAAFPSTLATNFLVLVGMFVLAFLFIKITTP